MEYSKIIAVSNNKQGNGVTIEVYDLTGRKQYTHTTLTSRQGTLSIDLSSLASLAKGVYIVNARNGDEAIQHKLLKLK